MKGKLMTERGKRRGNSFREPVVFMMFKLYYLFALLLLLHYLFYCFRCCWHSFSPQRMDTLFLYFSSKPNMRNDAMSTVPKRTIQPALSHWRRAAVFIRRGGGLSVRARASVCPSIHLSMSPRQFTPKVSCNPTETQRCPHRPLLFVVAFSSDV